jgi:hypothetical protein
MPFDGTINALPAIDYAIAALRDERQWIKGAGRAIQPDGSVAYCLIGAMVAGLIQQFRDRDQRNIIRSPLLRQVSDSVRDVTHAETDSDCEVIYDFNDAGTTTHAMVMEVLFKVRGQIQTDPCSTLATETSFAML